MSVIGVIEWAPVGLGKRMGILGLVQAHRLARKEGSIDAHNATTAKTLFVMLRRRGRNLFGNDYPPTTDEKRDHKFFETVCCYSRVGQGSPFFIYFSGGNASLWLR